MNTAHTNTARTNTKRKTPLLTAAQEVALAKAIEAGLFAQHKMDTHPALTRLERRDLLAVATAGVEAKERMVEANMGLVHVIARRYRGRNVEFEDLVQEGTIGLIKAIERFDYEQGFKFSTFATWYIWQAVKDLTTATAHTIRLPRAAFEAVAKVCAVRDRLAVELDAEPTIDQIAAGAGMTAAQVAQALEDERRSRMVRLDAAQSYVYAGISRTLHDEIGDGTDFAEDLTDAMTYNLETGLTELEDLANTKGEDGRELATVLRLRFPADRRTNRPMAEIGHHVGRSRFYADTRVKRGLELLSQTQWAKGAAA